MHREASHRNTRAHRQTNRQKIVTDVKVTQKKQGENTQTKLSELLRESS